MSTQTTVQKYNEELNTELAVPEVNAALLATTFKGLDAKKMKQAALEGMIRGFTFKDFLEKNVYAVPFGTGYSLVTSIDYSRKIGMRSGVVGVSAPTYVDDESGKPVTCSITVKRQIPETGYIGEYTATVYFGEYSTGKQQWASKPRTMIAKVAEMHALRKACPEVLAQNYAEEEMEREVITIEDEVDTSEWEVKLNDTKTIEELTKVWVSVPPKVKTLLANLKEELKKKYETENVSGQGEMAGGQIG